jgi:hypothetical protein
MQNHPTPSRRRIAGCFPAPAAAFLASSWIFLLHIYLPPKPEIGYLFIVFSFLLCLGWVWQTKETRIGDFLVGRFRTSGLGVIGCALAFVVFPHPYNVGLIPLGLGWLLLLLPNRSKAVRNLAETLLWVGFLSVLCAAVMPLVFAWTARVHPLGGVGRILAMGIAGLLRLFGQPAEVLPGGAVFLRSFEDAFKITVTAEKLLPVPFLLFLLLQSCIILIYSGRSRWESLFWFWIVFLGYSVLRLSLLILLMLQRVNNSWFFDPWVMTLSLLPLALWNGTGLSTLPLLTRHRVENANRKEQTKFKDHLISMVPGLRGADPISFIMGFILAASIFIGFTFRDPGTPKAGRLLINEHGSDWEWTTDTLNTEIYNEKTTYNYYSLADWLKYYYDVKLNFDPIEARTLQDVDVLILKIPTQPYRPEEIEAVVQYVRRGGSLWVIGDHTNVFGSSSFFNPLLRRFGCSFNYNSTHDLKSGNMSLFRRPERFAHPSVVNLPPYLFATSCSVNAPWSADAAILGYGMRADHLDYSQKNFFADRSRKQFDFDFGLMLQQIAMKFGRGRLVIYTDSTTFSNFFIFIQGKPELVLGTLNWLNHRPKSAWVNSLAWVLAALALLAMIFLRCWNGAAAAGFLIAASLAGWTTDNLSKKAHPLPEPRQSIPYVNFEHEHSDYFLPVLRLEQDQDKSFLTFYVWVQRVGAVPRESDDFSRAVSGADPVILIDPVQDFTPEEAAQLRHFLEKGGRALLINSADNPSSAPQKLLEPYGLRLMTVSGTLDSLHNLTLQDRYFPLVINSKFQFIQGGDTFLSSNQGEAIGVEKAVGSGRLYVLSCGHLFRNRYYGQTGIVPDRGLKALYDVEFDLIRKLLRRE